jgi:hypothetical protein
MTVWATERTSDIYSLLIPSNTTKKGVQLPQVLYASDSDGFHTTKVTGGLFPWYDTAYHYAGFTYQFGHFTQNGWSSDGSQLGLVQVRDPIDLLATARFSPIAELAVDLILQALQVLDLALELGDHLQVGLDRGVLTAKIVQTTRLRFLSSQH